MTLDPESGFSKLELKPDDLIILRGDDERGINKLVATLRRIPVPPGQKNMILVLRPGQSIESASEVDMNAAGWFRAAAPEPSCH